MAVFSSVFILSGPPLKIASLAASTASAEQILGSNVQFAINADQDITIVYGTSGMSAPTAANFRIPGGQIVTLDMGRNSDRIRVFNLSGTTAANVYICPLSRF